MALLLLPFVLLLKPPIPIFNTFKVSGSSSRIVPPSGNILKLFIFVAGNGSKPKKKKTTHPTLKLRLPFSSLSLNRASYCPSSNLKSSQSHQQTTFNTSNGSLKCTSYLSYDSLRSQYNSQSIEALSTWAINWVKLQHSLNILRYLSATDEAKTKNNSRTKRSSRKTQRTNPFSHIFRWCAYTSPPSISSTENNLALRSFLLRGLTTSSKCYLVPTIGKTIITLKNNKSPSKVASRSSSSIDSLNISLSETKGNITGYIRYTLFGYNGQPIIYTKNNGKKHYISFKIFPSTRFSLKNETVNGERERSNQCDLPTLLNSYSEKSLTIESIQACSKTQSIKR